MALERQKKALSQFFAHESGAVTVDWVVLTAGVVALASAVTYTLVGGEGRPGLMDGLRSAIEHAASPTRPTVDEVERVGRP